MSKELEALKQIYNGMYNKQGFIKEFKAIEKALTELETLKQEIIERQETEESLGKELIKVGDELEQLKRDVKRFVDLYHAFEEHGLCGDEADEFLKLEEKLMEVGAKDV